MRRGVKLWIDDELIIDKWENEALRKGVLRQCYGTDQECSYGEELLCSSSQTHSVITSDSARQVRSIIANSCPAYNQSFTAQAQLSSATVQYWNVQLPVNPVMSQIPTHVAKTGRSAVGVIGFAVNGVPFYGPMDDFSSSRKWSEQQSLYDGCNGHVDTLGIYHYHGNPMCLYGSDLGRHSLLVGFMLDGIPIYGPLDVGGVKAGELIGVARLDECGGHTDEEHVFYHYHVGSEKSHVINCLRGCLQGVVYNGSNININSQSPCISSSLQYDYTKVSAFKVSKIGTLPSRMKAASLRTHSGQAYLEAGSFHKIKVEYVHHAGYAAMHLYWSPGLGDRRIATEFFLFNPVKWCGDTVLCSQHIFTVQAGLASAAASFLSPLDNMKLDVVTPIYDDSYASALALLPKYSQPNYISESGDIVFTVTSVDAGGNVRFDGGDSFTLKVLRHVTTGTAQEASGTSMVLASNASADDYTYNGLALETTEGTGSGHRVNIQNYFGETRTAIATFTTTPDSSTKYIVGPEEDVGIQALGNGYYMARPQLTISSNYTLWVMLSGTSHTHGSPFHVYVGASKFSAADSYANVKYVWEAGRAETLYIIAKDRFGNNVTGVSSFSDSCTKRCAAFRFSAVIRSSIATSLVTQGRIAVAGDASYFTMASTSSAFPTQYVGYAVNIGGETRNITHHGNTGNSSANQGRVVTVNTAFSSPPAAGDNYFVTRIMDVKPRPMRICRMSDADSRTSTGVNALALCPALLDTGEYTLDIKSSGQALSNSPMRVLVHPSWKCASKSTASGMGLTLATAGAAATFTITTRDSFSQLSTMGGDGFSVSADRAGAVMAMQYFSYCAPSLTECSVSSSGIGTQSIADQDTGTYLVAFTPTRSGKYRINVKLGLYSELFGSPYQLYVRPGSICASRSYVQGDGLTLATSGQQSRFTVFAQDSFSNSVQFLNANALDCVDSTISPGTCGLTVSIGSSVTKVEPRDSGFDVITSEEPAAGWDVAYTIDKTFPTRNYTTTLSVNGNYISNILSGGLFATYYSDTDLMVPVVIKTVAAIDFSGDGVGLSGGVDALVDNWPWKGLKVLSSTSTVYADANFAARWTGLIEPEYNQIYTFGLSISDVGERVRLWVDNSLIVDDWTSLASLHPTGTYHFTKDFNLYDIKVEFVERGANTRKLSLLWQTKEFGDGNFVPVPSDKLRREAQSFTTLVLENRPSVALLSTASGNALSLSTAGSYSYFTVTARDILQTIEEIDSKTQRLDFQGRTGREMGGLFATYYRDSDLLYPMRSLTQPTIYFLTSNTTLTKEMAMPTPADQADIVRVASASTLGATVGSDIYIDDELMRVLSISSNTITVTRGRAGSAIAPHLKGETVNTVPILDFTSSNAYSVRWSGLVRPQYGSLYTFKATVAEIDERIKLWIDDALLVDAWSSISATTLTATWPSPSANGYYSIKVEYKEFHGKDGYSLSWASNNQASVLVPSDRLYTGNSILHAELVSTGLGTYKGRYMTTLSGAYQSMLSINTAGGLAATYYADQDCIKYAYHRTDPEVNFNWGPFSPHKSVPRDFFCVRWAGMLAPVSSEEHKFIISADDSARLWIDDELLIDHTVDLGLNSWATKMLNKEYLYPIIVEYREQQHHANIKLMWSASNLKKTSIASIQARETTCSIRPDQLRDCLASSTSGASGGSNFIAGNIIVNGGTPSASATFTVDDRGSISIVSVNEGGSGYDESVSPDHVDILYSDTNISQILSVTSISIENSGSGYIPGQFRVLGSNTSDFAWGEFDTFAGQITKVYFHSHGSGYTELINSNRVELLFPANLREEDTLQIQIATVTSVAINGTKTTNYDSDSEMTVTCSAPCTGAGLKAKCSVRSGIVVHVEVVNRGVGYDSSNPPSLACPGGAGHTFTPVIASGAVFSPKVALGARLVPHLVGNATKIIPSSHLFGTQEAIQGWSGTEDYHTLTVQPQLLCGSTSSIQGGGIGWAISLSTVGFPASFTVVARDEYGNIRTGPESTTERDFFVSRLVWNESSMERIISGAGSTDAGTIATSVVPGRYDFSVSSSIHTTAGYRIMQTSLISQGGLSATYYTGSKHAYGSVDPVRFPSMSFPTKGQTDATVDFSGASASTNWPICQPGNGQYPFGVRWSGFVRQTTGTSATYTFSFSLKHAAERVRLWLSNSLVLDQWSSLASLTPSMSTHATFPSSASNSVFVDYKSRDETRGITMNWKDSSGVQVVVPSSRLFAHYDVIGGYREEYVQGGSTAGDALLLTGDAVSVATAFSAATFTIVARDRYDNMITNAEVFSIRLSGAQADAQQGVPIEFGQGKYVGSYLVTSAVTQTLSVSLPQLGGLYATYFSSDDFTSGKYIRVDRMKALVGSGDATGEDIWPGQPGEPMAATAFSVRWEGFLKPSLPTRYQFKVGLADADDRIKLWIDNSLIIEQWESLDSMRVSGTHHFTIPDTLFDIKIEYKEKIGLHGMSLSWSTAPISTVIIDDLGCNTGCTNSLASIVQKSDWLEESTTAGFFGTGYHQDGNNAKGIREFWFQYPEAFGVYDVYLYYPASASFDSKVPVTVAHGRGNSLHYVDQTVTQANGAFLGRYAFLNGATVVVKNAGTTKTVIADAVKFVNNVLSSDRVLHCGQVIGTQSAREFSIVASKLFANTDSNYLNGYMWIGNEKGLIIKSLNGNQLTLDRSFSMGSTTLSSALTGTATSLSVVDAGYSGIIVGRFLEIGSEVMRVTAVSANTVTIERGYLSTAAMAHESGSTVQTILLPGSVIESGIVGAVTSASVLQIAASAPNGNDIFLGYALSLAFGGFMQSRTIVAYSSRTVTVSPAFDSIPIQGVSLYQITAKCLFTITKTLLVDEQGADCLECSIPPSLLYANPRTQKSVVIERDLRRTIPSSDFLSTATAGIVKSFSITVRDVFGNMLASDPGSVVFMNGTQITNTYGYGASILATGSVVVGGDKYSFTLDGSSDGISGVYVGHYISVAGETRTIVEYTSARVVSVNVPFSSAPVVAAIYTISSVQSGLEWYGKNGGFVGSVCDMSVAANPCNISFLATTAGVYAVEVQLYRVGGLQANYYHNPWLQGSPSTVKVEPTVNHDWGFGLITDTARDHIGARWTGLVKADFTEVYTFVTNTTGYGPALTVNGVTLVDQFEIDTGCVEYDAAGGCLWRTEFFQWTFDFPSSGVESVDSGTIALTAGNFYEISLTYKHRTGAASIQLWWTSTNVPLQIIPSSSLYAARDKAPGSPVKLRVHPSATMCSNNAAVDASIRCTTCGSVGMLYGAGLTAVTAGVVATFNLQSKDQYGNIAEIPGSPIVVRVDGNPRCGAAGSGRYYSGWCTPATSVTPSSTSTAGLFKYNFTAVTDTADSKISVAALEIGGLFATYYTESPCNEVMSTRAKSGSGVASVEVVSMGSSCTADGTLSATGGGPGTGFSAKFTQRGGSVDRIIVTNAGRGYDSIPSISCCNMIISIAVTGTGSSYTSGGAATASCAGVTGCIGTGFAGTCVGDGAVVTSIFVINPGTGYLSTAPPAITCANGSGHTFTPTIDTSTGGTGCLGTKFAAAMQFTNNYETFLDTAPRLPNPWWDADIGSSGAGLTKCALFTPHKVEVDATVDFSGGSSAGDIGISTWPGTGALSQDGNWFSVRWAGFVLAPSNGAYTFTSMINSADERLKLWVDNSILIDQWSSLKALDVSGTIGTWVQDTYYSVQVLYKEEVGAHSIQLKWTVPSATTVTIPSTHLFSAYNAEASPRSIKLYPDVPCSSTSMSSGMGLSLVTAGILSAFTVSVRDRYGNLRQTLHDEASGYAFKSFVRIDSLRTVHLSTTDQADGLQMCTYNITTSGSHTLNTFIAHAGGLHATYYDDAAFSGNLALAVRTDTTIDFSGSGDNTSASVWPGIFGHDFGVRWGGFMRAPYDSVYTMSIAIGSSNPYNAPTNDRIKLWIDNKLVIEQWTSLSSQTPSGTFNFAKPEYLYDITIEYKHYDTTQQAVLKWKSQGSYAAAACDFSSPSPAPPAYDVAICGWRLESDCDSGASICLGSQTKILYSSTSSSGNAHFGSSVAFIGDGDGDGVQDLAVGAPSDDTVDTDAGAIYILLLTISGTLKTAAPPRVAYVKITQDSNMGTCTTASACLMAGDAFGSAVASMGDLNGNGYADIAVSSKGAVFILFMDQDKSVHCYECPPQVQSFTKLDVTLYFGNGNIPTSLAALDDLDGNGVVDLAVGFDGASDGEVMILFLSRTDCTGGAAICFLPSSVEIKDGVSGFTETCVGGSCKFGSSIASIGDINGDSVPDLVVGAKADDCGGTDRGAVYVLFLNSGSWTVRNSVKLCTGANGLFATDIPNNGAEFGSSVASAGDINGDGIPDLLVGAPKEYTNGTIITGAIYWFTLSRSGTVITSKKWGGQTDVQVTQTLQGLGMSLTAVKDINRDGMGDVISGVGWDASLEGAVTALLPSSWSKWKSAGSPVGGTPTSNTGPSVPSSGSSFVYHTTGIVCNDGTIFKNYAGNTLGGEYSFMFEGTDSACATRCANDELCNFYTAGIASSCITYRTCWKQDTNADAAAVTYRKASYLFIEADSLGTNAAPGTAYFVTVPDDYARVVFYYHMFGVDTGTLSLEVKSKSVVINSGVVSAVADATIFTLDATAPAIVGAWVGKLIQIGTSTREISGYTHQRVVTLSTAFDTAPIASSSMYKIYEKQTRCADKNACGHQNDWSTIWSLSGQQQASGEERWKMAEVFLSSIARPVELRFRASRGAAGTACDIAIDRIHVYQYNTPISSVTGRSRTTELQVVPSNRLYMGYHTANSPFTLTVRTADTSPSISACTDCSSKTSISAAASTTYSVTLKDAFDNVRLFTNANEGNVTVGRPGQMYVTNHEDGLVVLLESLTNPNERLIADTALSSGATYDSGLAPTGLDETASSQTFASAELTIRLSRVGGLNATYHRVVDLAFPVFERVDQTIDFSFTQRVPGAPAIVPPDFFSVRWKGFVRPPTSETWTFKTSTLSSSASTGKEGVRLWMSGFHMGELSLVIDRWDGLETEYTGTLSMLAEKLYEIQMEYKDTYSSSKVQLMWKSASTYWTTYSIVPSDRLYYDSEHLSPTSPMTVTVTA